MDPDFLLEYIFVSLGSVAIVVFIILVALTSRAEDKKSHLKLEE